MLTAENAKNVTLSLRGGGIRKVYHSGSQKVYHPEAICDV